MRVAFALLMIACQPDDDVPPRTRPPDILLIIVDTLRTDHVGAWGHHRNTTPRLDAFAKEAVLFNRAYASAPWTMPSVASMLTGLHPSSHTVVRATSELPEIM